MKKKVTVRVAPIKKVFEQCHSAEKCESGTFWDFVTSILLQISKQMKGKPFCAIQ